MDLEFRVLDDCGYFRLFQSSRDEELCTIKIEGYIQSKIFGFFLY